MPLLGSEYFTSLTFHYKSVRSVAAAKENWLFPCARFKPPLVEHVIREQNILAANEIIELFCELIVSRLAIITKHKECPVDLKEGIASLIFAAPRCSEIPELGDLKDIFEKKYGRDFVSAATELRPTCGVNRMLVVKLSVTRPEGEFKLKVMKEIAKEFQVDWDTKETEQELLKPKEETIDGPRAFISASSLPVERASQDLIDPTKAVPRSSSSLSINKHYHDTESAAEAAAELAKQAVEAAQVAALLANRRDSTTEDHYHPGSTRQSLDSETSSYYAKPYVRRHSCNNPCVNNEADHMEEAKEAVRRRHSYNSPPLPPPATSEIKFDESDYEEETEPEEGLLQSRASSLPPNRAPPQAPQSRRDSSGHQVHPKLPDYDTLAARFEAIRHSKGPLI
ncbi:PREDICTED: IST1-like protein isoform X2 [Brassica oleracea var. oleracea]|uniref:IST1-like protein isoform X2 n=1 Tax=Brassica oleracea var. oleracea TaxID=109376 RepID=UPI0006A6CF85|nr:PREDICTED: IST1-like protein isoform X2 [Brassica oleracea var. oleracea]